MKIFSFVLAAALFSFGSAQVSGLMTTDDMTTTVFCECTNYTTNDYVMDDYSGCKHDGSPVCTPDSNGYDDACVCVDWSDVVEALATAIIIAIVIGGLICLGVLVAICCCICGGVACCAAAGANAQAKNQQAQMTNV